MEMQNMRRLPLERALNVRDLGGYAVSSRGEATRWRAFLRSAGTQGMTDADIEFLKAYGVTDTIDLRSSHETQREPSRLAMAEGVTGHSVPMLDNIMSGPVTGMPETLGDLYISLLDGAKEDFAKIFRIFAAAGGAVLFHCSAGKDRTGTTAMLLLNLAGVSDDDIVADYAVSELYLYHFIQAKMKEFEQYGVDMGMLGSQPDNMRRALAHLKQNYTDAESYLKGAGLTNGEIEAVRRKLVG